MPVTFGSSPFRLNAQEAGGLGGNIANAMQGFQEGVKTMYAPKSAAEALLGMQLQNKINQAKAKYADQRENALLQSTLLGNQTKSISNSELGQRLHAALTGQNLSNEGKRNSIQEAIQQAELRKKYPLLGQPGIAGQIGSFMYAKDHPELFGEIGGEAAPQENQIEEGASLIPSISGSNIPATNAKLSYINMWQKALEESFKPKERALHGVAAEADSLRRLRETYGEDSQVFKDAEKLAGIKADSAMALNKQRERRAEGLPLGQDWVKDSEGNNIGISRDFSPAEKKEEKGRLFFNEVYPFILKSTSYYSGPGSITRFENDALKYGKDQSATKRIDNYLAATKLLPSALVKENATVGGANTNQVYKRLLDSLNSSDLPKKAESIIKQFQIPLNAQINSGKIFSDKLNSATEKSKNIPARHTEYMNNKRRGHIIDPATKKLKEVMVSPQNWDAFVQAGGY